MCVDVEENQLCPERAEAFVCVLSVSSRIYDLISRLDHTIIVICSVFGEKYVLKGPCMGR